MLIRPFGTNFSEILIKIHTFSFKKLNLKMSSGKWGQFFSALVYQMDACDIKWLFHVDIVHVQDA